MLNRLPALPLIANDPYFSVWMPSDTLNGAESIHWAGEPKPLIGFIQIDGTDYAYLGKTGKLRMKTISVEVTPTRTISVLEAGGISLTVTFWTPALPDDLDVLSTPITLVDYAVKATDGKEHEVKLILNVSSALCYDGIVPPPMTGDVFTRDGLKMAYIGQKQQKILCHSGDHITIDWGYLYLAAEANQEVSSGGNLHWNCSAWVGAEPVRTHVLLGYDDIASINYYGVPCKAWHARNGETIPDALSSFHARYDELYAACEALDKAVLDEAEEKGGEDYAKICAAAWRHTFAAHKLIATPDGQMAFLSKENDSNGCIGTVDVSYPSIPLFLRYCPELVNAMCLPVLQFANMPVWDEDFAPHDVGRYPYVYGQRYAAPGCPNGEVYRPFYLYPAGSGIYDMARQMPVEECGNMLIMMETAVTYGASDELIRKYSDTLAKWVVYLDRYGEDPGEQLCTDDFAGHLAHNINLSAKAVMGIACYSRIMKRLGNEQECAKWENRAREMAKSWLDRAMVGDYSALTFDGQGWSMKYNLVWDRILNLGLLPEEFYSKETRSYLSRINEYGLPLDSRREYTKSDWMVWTACLAPDSETFKAIIAPLAYYLENTSTRVPFSDWYDTETGKFVSFIARSVQGGVYMRLLF